MLEPSSLWAGGGGLAALLGAADGSVTGWGLQRMYLDAGFAGCGTYISIKGQSLKSARGAIVLIGIGNRNKASRVQLHELCHAA